MNTSPPIPPWSGSADIFCDHESTDTFGNFDCPGSAFSESLFTDATTTAFVYPMIYNQPASSWPATISWSYQVLSITGNGGSACKVDTADNGQAISVSVSGKKGTFFKDCKLKVQLFISEGSYTWTNTAEVEVVVGQ